MRCLQIFKEENDIFSFSSFCTLRDQNHLLLVFVNEGPPCFMADQAFIYVGGCSIGIQQSFFLSAVNVFADEEGLVTRGMVPHFFYFF